MVFADSEHRVRAAALLRARAKGHGCRMATIHTSDVSQAFMTMIDMTTMSAAFFEVASE